MGSSEKGVTRDEALSALAEVKEYVLSYFPEGKTTKDTFGFDIGKPIVENYLAESSERTAMLIQEAVRLSPGQRVAEVGPAFGMNLLALTRHFGFTACGYEIPANIDVYCRPLLSAGIPVRGFDLYDEAPIDVEMPYDLLLCSEVIEHAFMAVETCIERLRYLVRVGGILLLTTPNIYRRRNMLRLLRGRNVCGPHPALPRMRNGIVVDGRTHPREYTMFEVVDGFAASGHWELVDIRCPLWKGALGGNKDRLRYVLLRLLFRLQMGDDIMAAARRIS